jgi:hypothetical protein
MILLFQEAEELLEVEVVVKALMDQEVELVEKVFPVPVALEAERQR